LIVDRKQILDCYIFVSFKGKNMTTKNNKKPGFIRRFFRGLMATITWLRHLVLNVIFLALVIGIFVLLSKDIPEMPEQTALLLNPSGVVVEQRSYSDPLRAILGSQYVQEQEVLLQDIIDAIQHAADDKRVTSMVLQLDQLVAVSLSQMQEIAAALDHFRATDKPIIAIADNYSQSQYWLATQADEVYLNPMGAVYIQGYGLYRLYYQEALDKLGVNMHVFSMGQFKSAAEPFTRDGMSPAAREANRAWLNQLWSQYTASISERLDLAADALDDYIDHMNQRLAQQQGNPAQAAMVAGLVDGLKTRAAMNDYLIAKAGAKDSDGYYQHIDFNHYLRFYARDKTPVDNGNKVAVIVAEGMILDGKQPAGTIGADSLSELIRQARRDDDVRALVLRIDSGGGSAFASEVIRNELLALQQTGKPLVVSMGSVAASGAYWIAASADEIWATSATLTGSIGIFGAFPTFAQSLAKLGIHSDGLGTTDLADFMRLDRPLSPLAADILQQAVDHGYQQFLDIVAAGRNMSDEQVAAAAGGRVWSAPDAQRLGLIDKLGSLNDAVAAAAQLAQLEKYQRKLIELPLSPREAFIRQLTETAWWPGIGQLWPLPFDDAASLLKTFNDPQGLYARCLPCVAL
jgi:protease-4